MKRRDFLARAAAVGLGAAAAFSAEGKRDDDELPFLGEFGPPKSLQQPRRHKKPTRLARRQYGLKGPELSLVGLGGIVVSEIEQKDANEIVAWAVDRGVNYFDVAPTYGNAQERLGPALKPYRKKAFLACKTGKRDAAGAQAELEQSLKLLQTDHFDLYQLHGLTKVEEVAQALGPGGALEAFSRAREKGQVRYLGFSAHSIEAALKALDGFHFDSMLFPVNVVCIQNGHFGPQVLEHASKRSVACLALKALAWTPWPKDAEKKYPKCWYQPIDDPALASLALRFTLDQPVVAVLPPGDVRLFKLAVEAALEYKPLSDAEKQDLRLRTVGVEPIFKAES